MEAFFIKAAEKYQPGYREKLVYVNPKNNQISLNISDFKTTWGFGKPALDTYVAKLTIEAKGSTGQFKVDDFSTGKKINLSIEYLLQLNEVHLDNALQTHLRLEGVEKVFNDQIRQFVKDFGRDHDLIDSPDYHLPDLQRYITARLAQVEPGFVITLRVNLVDYTPQKEQVSCEGLKLRFRGGKGDVMIHFDAEVTVDQLNRDIARQSKLNDKAQLLVHLQEWIKAHFIEQVSAADFFNRTYRRTTLTDQLESMLNRELRSHGRKLVFFEINENFLREHSAPGTITVPVQVACQVRQASKFIQLDVSTKVTMELDDEGKAILAGMTNPGALEAWAMKNITEIVETTFLEQKDFADIVISFFDGYNTIENSIGNELRRRAENIGYRLKYYNVLPHLSEYENKHIEVIVSDMVFTTKGGDIPLSLSFEIEGTIKNWGDIKEYLRPDKDLNKSIKEKAIAAVKEVLLDNDAHRLYLHFYEPYGHQPSVEKELQDKITSALDEFRLEELKIRLIPAGSDIKTRSSKILNKKRSASIVFKSLKKDSPPENIYYHFNFSIIGIVGFNVFYSSKDLEIEPWMQQISESLESLLTIFLQTIEAQHVKYEHEEVRRYLEQVFRQDYAVPEIKRGFGLEIDIFEFRRDLTEKERVESRTASHYFAEKGKIDQERISKEFVKLLDAGDTEREKITERLEYLRQNAFRTAEEEEEMRNLEKQLLALKKRQENPIDALHAKYGGESPAVDPLALLEAKIAQRQLNTVQRPALEEKNDNSEPE